MRSIPLPPVLFLSCLVAGSLLERLLPVSLRLPAFRSSRLIGAALLLAAFGIGATALVTLLKRHTSPDPNAIPTVLVSNGIFALSRNPMYLSLVLALGGVGVMSESVWILAAAGVLCVLLDRVVIRSEERTMTEAFGDDYLAYKRRVRRWL